MNDNMQRWMPMQRWQSGGVRCWMSGAGQTHGIPSMEKARVNLSILIGDIVLIPSALFRSHVELRS